MQIINQSDIYQQILTQMEQKEVNLLSYLNQFCPICHNQYDDLSYIPMMLCRQQHLCCKSCVQELKQTQRFRCPECRRPISESEVTVFRRFYKIIEEKKGVKIDRMKDIQHMQQQLTDGQMNSLKRPNPESEADLDHLRGYKKFKDNQLQKLEKAMLNEALNNFRDKQIRKCINKCKTIIENNPQQKGSFLGLGSKEQQTGYYQSEVLQWFLRENYSSKASCYDLLNLCFLIDKQEKEAKQWYDKMVLLHPNNTQLLYGLALTEHNSGKIDKAQQVYKRIIDVDPNFCKAYQMLAFVAWKKKEGDILALITKCKQRQENNVFAQFLLACFYNQQDMDEEFQDLVDQIFKKHPKFIRIINLRGQRLFSKQSYKQAKQVFQICIKKNKYYEQPFINYLRCLKQLEQYQLAQNFSKQNQPLLKENPQYYFQLGERRRKTKKYKSSISYYKKCASINEKHCKVYLGLADVYLISNNGERALQMYNKHLQNYPNSTLTYQSIIKIYEKGKKFEQAIQWSQKLFHLNQDEQIYFKIGQYYIQLKEHQKAMQNLNRCLEKGVRVDDVFPLILEVLQKQSRYEECIKMAKNWIIASPSNSQSWLSLSNIFKTISENVKTKKWQPLDGVKDMI